MKWYYLIWDILMGDSENTKTWSVTDSLVCSAVWSRSSCNFCFFTGLLRTLSGDSFLSFGFLVLVVWLETSPSSEASPAGGKVAAPSAGSQRAAISKMLVVSASTRGSIQAPELVFTVLGLFGEFIAKQVRGCIFKYGIWLSHIDQLRIHVHESLFLLS